RAAEAELGGVVGALLDRVDGDSGQVGDLQVAVDRRDIHARDRAEDRGGGNGERDALAAAGEIVAEAQQDAAVNAALRADQEPALRVEGQRVGGAGREAE